MAKDHVNATVTLTLGEWRRLVNAAKRMVPELADTVLRQMPCDHCALPITDEGGMLSRREGKRWHAQCYALVTLPASLAAKLKANGHL